MMRVTGISLVAVTACCLAACTDPTCTEQDVVYTSSVDGAPSGGAPVAHFELSQTYKSYGPVGCSGEPFQPVGVVTATATSLVSEPVALSFELQGLNEEGVTSWGSPGALAHIHSGETVDLGPVAVATARLQSGARAFVTEVVPLPTARDDALVINAGGSATFDLTIANPSLPDLLDVPAAPVVSFGGGTLGGAVTDHAAGTTVAFAGGTLSIDAAGILTISAPPTAGSYSVMYEVSNGARSSVATVLIRVT
jgi:hypothetical protein